MTCSDTRCRKNQKLIQSCDYLQGEIDDLCREYTTMQLMDPGLGDADRSVSDLSRAETMSSAQDDKSEGQDVEEDGLAQSQSSVGPSEAARRQAQYDRAVMAAKLLAAEVYKGNDRLHDAHMQDVLEKYNKCVSIHKRLEESSHLLAQLDQDHRDTQLCNTFAQEEIDLQLDKIVTLETQVACLKKELVTTSQRQYKYLQELKELVADQDEPVMSLRTELHQAKSHRQHLQNERDKAFQKLIDLQVERRIMLGKVNIQDKSVRLLQQSDMQECRQIRGAAHDQVAAALAEWEQDSQLYHNLMAANPGQDKLTVLNPAEQEQNAQVIHRHLVELEERTDFLA